MLPILLETGILETCTRKPAQNCPENLWLPFPYRLFSSLHAPLQKKKLMLLLRVLYQDWSPRCPSASHLRRNLWPPTAQVSQESSQLQGLVKVVSSQSQLSTRRTWPWACFCSLVSSSEMGCSELSQPPVPDAERCVSSLKNSTFGSHILCRGILGLPLVSLYSRFFSLVASSLHFLKERCWAVRMPLTSPSSWAVFPRLSDNVSDIRGAHVLCGLSVASTVL